MIHIQSPSPSPAIIKSLLNHIDIHDNNSVIKNWPTFCLSEFKNFYATTELRSSFILHIVVLRIIALAMTHFAKMRTCHRWQINDLGPCPVITNNSVLEY